MSGNWLFNPSERIKQFYAKFSCKCGEQFFIPVRCTENELKKKEYTCIKCSRTLKAIVK